MLHAVYPAAKFQPQISAPEPFASRTWSREDALTEIVRGRLQALGPTTAPAIADALAVPPTAHRSCTADSRERGFRPARPVHRATPQTEWCERRLLARIHRYTIRTLRAEIEPVASADFMRFLLDWQGVTREPRGEGVEALAAVVEQLQGFELPAAAWEADVLASRLNDYDPNWLDSLCLVGARAVGETDARQGRDRGAGARDARFRFSPARIGRSGSHSPMRSRTEVSCLTQRLRLPTTCAPMAPRSSTTW